MSAIEPRPEGTGPPGHARPTRGRTGAGGTWGERPRVRRQRTRM
ncbi:MAG: hypothetical protein NTY37_06750 [Methanothrix sp.]|nr:hypothetical protein [Methanothrix sp.]